MISRSIQFLVEEVNNYLSLKLGLLTDPRLVLGNVAKVFDADNSGNNSLSNKAIASLVNVEEDKVFKQQENYIKTYTGVQYKAPPLYVNLYVLFSLNRNEYSDSLNWLSHIMHFFQHQNVFTPLSHPNLNSGIERLIVELQTLNFEQINHLWSTLGGKYLPSVLYRVKQVTIDENLVTGEGGLITEVEINERSLTPVS